MRYSSRKVYTENQTMKKELLAPAGDIEAGYAALYYGADAVYLGLKQFSARATAGNFSAEELCEFTGFAHHLNRRVFVTINTVLQQSELKDLFKNLDLCRQAKVDAVILQDLGVARIMQKYYPEIERHASTQMAVHNKAGALALQKMGFHRVVLARELSLTEIKDIATIPNLELEAFVHGALCYSYSGVCQFSSMTEGRSANRGKCMYPCRSAFAKGDKSEHCFSMKDLALGEDVLKLPVYSLKIEGRKKNALYVAAVTDYYRHILDGDGALPAKAQNIKQIFSRPWCEFHFKGKNKEVTDKYFVGHRGLPIGKISVIKGNKFVVTTSFKIARHDGIQIDVEGLERPYGFSLQKFSIDGHWVWEADAGKTVEISLPQKVDGLKVGAMVYLASSSEVKGAYGYEKPRPHEFMPRYPVDVDVRLSATEVEASSCGEKAVLKGNFAPAQNVAKTEEAIAKAFGKTGDTALELRHLRIDNSGGLFVPISQLNELRRQLYEQIVPEYQSVTLYPIEPRPLPKSKKWIVKTDRAENLSLVDWQKTDEVIFALSPVTTLSELASLPKNKVRLALPTICRRTDDFVPLIAKLLDAGYKKWEISNYWGLSALPVGHIDLSFDNMIYMFNVEAIEKAKELKASRVTFAVEDTLNNLTTLSMETPLPVAMIVYQDVPLFTSAVCLRDNACKDCDHKPLWLDLQRDGKKYKALSKNCQMTVFGDKALSVAADAKNLYVDFYRADFCYRSYTPQQVKQILDSLQSFTDGANTLKGNIERKGNVF
jgi:putative protease